MDDVNLSLLMRDHLLKGFIGKHATFTELVKKLKQVADKNIAVLLTGETGSGKSLCSEFIHHSSDRCNAPFIIFNCGICSEDLLASQLFGSKKGAFTGAHEDSAGLVEMAHGGTLVLDEINSLDIHSQVKLNYFLEKNYFRRLGETKLRHRDVRVISISNVDLRREVQEGRFRRDLYYRLAEYEIFVPPLRSRKEDIVPLINHFLEIYSDLNNLGPITFSDEVLDELQNYDWPGNIRELKSFVKRCIIDAKTSVIDNVSAPTNKKPSTSTQAAFADSLPWRIAKKQAVASFETQYLKNLLKRYHGVVARCAKHADMQTPDFWKLMRKYDIKADDFRTEA